MRILLEKIQSELSLDKVVLFFSGVSSSGLRFIKRIELILKTPFIYILPIFYQFKLHAPLSRVIKFVKTLLKFLRLNLVKDQLSKLTQVFRNKRVVKRNWLWRASIQQNVCSCCRLKHLCHTACWTDVFLAFLKNLKFWVIFVTFCIRI